MTEREQLEKLLETKKQRLNVLELQSAGFGTMHAPAHLLVEIENLKSEITTLQSRLTALPIHNTPQPNSITSQIAQMDKAAEEEDWDTVIEIGEELLKKNSGRIILRLKIAKIYGKRAEFCLQHCDFNQAITDLNKAIEFELGNGYFYYLRGKTFNLTKSYPFAWQDLERAIELDPEKPHYYYELAHTYKSWDMPEKYRKALEETVKYGHELAKLELIPFLISDFKSNDTNIQNQAVLQLQEIGEAAVTALIATLKDDNEMIRWICAYVLGEIGDLKAIEPLIAALKDEKDGVQYNATLALGKIGDERALPELERVEQQEITHNFLTRKLSDVAAEAIAEIKARHNIK